MRRSQDLQPRMHADATMDLSRVAKSDGGRSARRIVLGECGCDARHLGHRF
jgi:hypothetical protein